jgi:hypothetical protein
MCMIVVLVLDAIRCVSHDVVVDALLVQLRCGCWLSECCVTLIMTVTSSRTWQFQPFDLAFRFVSVDADTGLKITCLRVTLSVNYCDIVRLKIYRPMGN